MVCMKEIRESLVSLWAKILNKEITQTNFWFLKKSSWVDIDVIGIKPGDNEISLYNVKANLNTSTEAHTPKRIAENFRETIYALNKAYNKEFNYNLYLIFESANLFGIRRKKTTFEWLETIKDNQQTYKEELMAELDSNEVKNINNLIVKSLYMCIQEIISRVIRSPTKTGSHCFKFKNEIYVYPFHKIPELKILDIYTDYHPKISK